MLFLRWKISWTCLHIFQSQFFRGQKAPFSGYQLVANVNARIGFFFNARDDKRLKKAELSHGPRKLCYSFFGNKEITTGEGGMVVTKDEGLRKYMQGGFGGGYEFEVAGLNYRMSNIHAAIGCAQLERAEEFHRRRTANAERYRKALKGNGHWLFVAQVRNPEEAINNLPCEARRVFPPLNEQRPFLQFGDFPQSRKAYETGVCLPTGPHLTEDQLGDIITRVKAYE